MKINNFLMKVNEQRIRFKAARKDSTNPNMSLNQPSAYSSRGNLIKPTDPTQRAATTNESVNFKSFNQRKDLNSALVGLKKPRDNISTSGGVSFMGGRSEFDVYEPPFLVLPDQ